MKHIFLQITRKFRRSFLTNDNPNRYPGVRRPHSDKDGYHYNRQLKPKKSNVEVWQ